MANDDRARSKPLIEKRSIDYIPEAERHVRLLSQFTLWLGANLQVTAIVTGALAVVLGGDVFWSLIGSPFAHHEVSFIVSLGDTDILWIVGLVVPAAMYYFAARKWHSAVPDRLILPVEQGEAVNVKTRGADSVAAI